MSQCALGVVLGSSVNGSVLLHTTRCVHRSSSSVKLQLLAGAIKIDASAPRDPAVDAEAAAPTSGPPQLGSAASHAAPRTWPLTCAEWRAGSVGPGARGGRRHALWSRPAPPRRAAAGEPQPAGAARSAGASLPEPLLPIPVEVKGGFARRRPARAARASRSAGVCSSRSQSERAASEVGGEHPWRTVPATNRRPSRTADAWERHPIGLLPRGRDAVAGSREPPAGWPRWGGEDGGVRGRGGGAGPAAAPRPWPRSGECSRWTRIPSGGRAHPAAPIPRRAGLGTVVPPLPQALGRIRRAPGRLPAPRPAARPPSRSGPQGRDGTAEPRAAPRWGVGAGRARRDRPVALVARGTRQRSRAAVGRGAEPGGCAAVRRLRALLTRDVVAPGQPSPSESGSDPRGKVTSGRRPLRGSRRTERRGWQPLGRWKGP